MTWITWTAFRPWRLRHSFLWHMLGTETKTSQIRNLVFWTFWLSQDEESGENSCRSKLCKVAKGSNAYGPGLYWSIGGLRSNSAKWWKACWAMDEVWPLTRERHTTKCFPFDRLTTLVTGGADDLTHCHWWSVRVNSLHWSCAVLVISSGAAGFCRPLRWRVVVSRKRTSHFNLQLVALWFIIVQKEWCK